MIKRKLLAWAIPAIIGISSVNAAEVVNKDGNKVDFNGKVDVSRLFSSDKTQERDDSFARFGFIGETQISDNLTGYGVWQYQFQLNNTEGAGEEARNGNRTRLGYVGLKFGDFGSIDYGRNTGLIYDVLAYTDMLPKFGGDSAGSDLFLTSRASGVATWRSSNFFGLVDGLSIAAQYQGKNERTGADALRRSNREGYAASIQYVDDSGIAAVAAWANLGRTDAQNRADFGRGDRAELWSAALKYDANQFYLAAMYGETRNATWLPNGMGYADKAQNVELVAQYQFLNGLRPSLAYVSSRGKDIEQLGNVDITKYASVGAKYYLNTNMALYVDYRINLLADDNELGLSTDDILGLGMVYQF